MHGELAQAPVQLPSARLLVNAQGTIYGVLPKGARTNARGIRFHDSVYVRAMPRDL